MFIKRHRGQGGGSGMRRALLSDCEAGVCATVVDNTGTRAMEMGFFPGASVRVLSNEEASVCLVVITGESRFVVPREIAATVVVRRRGGAFWRWRGGHA